MRASWAPMRVSSAAIVSPSRINHAVHPPDLAGLCLWMAEAARGTNEGQGRFGAGAGDFHGGGTSRLGERAVGQEGSAPDSLGVRSRISLTTYRWQAPDGAAAGVQESGLAGESSSPSRTTRTT